MSTPPDLLRSRVRRSIGESDGKTVTLDVADVERLLLISSVPPPTEAARPAKDTEDHG